MKTIFCLSLFLIVMLVSAAWGDLTGQWSCDDGGTYYLRQTGRQVNWYGEAAGAQPVWSNVFSGHIHEDRIKGNWTDVPKGRTAGSGDLELLIEKGGDALRVVNNTGGFGGSRWTRLNTGVPITRPLKPLKRSGNEDCIRFNPVTAHVFQTNGRWKIVDGGYWLFDFGSNQAAAEKALLVIKHYRMDRICLIGGPDPSFAYLLAKGGSPSGAMAGEACVAFDPKRVRLSKIKGSWKIVSGRHRLFDIGQSEADARQALAVIRRHGFSQACSVGRSDADFSYLRR